MIAVGLMLDPSLTRNDKLIGNVLGFSNNLSEVISGFTLEFFLLRKLITKNADSEANTKVEKIRKTESLKFNVGSTETHGTVEKVIDEKNEEGKIIKSLIRVKLQKSICASIGEKAAFCRKIDNKFRLIGWGEITEVKVFGQAKKTN